MKNILFIILIISNIFASISLSGDARVRPRLDVKEYPDESTQKESDLYYLYRARLNIKADIGDGYFFHAKLGTNEISGMSKMASDGNNSSIPGNLNSSRAQVDFLELYYGYKGEKSGLWAGAFPLKHNPALDIHYYPDKIVDIPFALLNNSSITGFGGYCTMSKYKLDWFISVDKQQTNSKIDIEGNKTELMDSYTLGFNSKINIGSMSIIPRLLFSIADSTEYSPLTFGTDINLMEITGFKPGVSYYMSQDSNRENDLSHIRLSVKKQFDLGQLKLFYDLASSKQKDSEKMDLTYLWASFSYMLHENEFGSIKLMPTVRIQNGSNSNPDFSRSKFELTTEIKFK
tara:strand:- start:97 stop:1131 length:1035 start_codon:yes stop_codon:yes gene_type:complete